MPILSTPLTIALLSLGFTLITVLFYYKQDKYEPEPLRLILLALFFGVLSPIPVLVISSILDVFLFSGGLTFLSATNGGGIFIVAPIVEESSKGLFVLILATRKDFDGPLDGLIYGAMVGAGFAFVENILYGLGATTFGFGVQLTIIRGALQILSHPLYTGLFGIAVGGHKVGLYSTQKMYLLLGRSILFHSVWNFFGVLLEGSVSFVVGLTGLLGVIIVAVIVLRRELKFTKLLDLQAFESGYYNQKNSVQIPPTSQIFSDPTFPSPPIQGFSQEAVTPTRICPACGNQISSSANYCRYCGVDLQKFQPSTKICPLCNAINEADANFCKVCGTVL